MNSEVRSRITWAVEMAQKAQVLATKPDKLSSIPRTYVVERPDPPKAWPLSPTCTHKTIRASKYE